LTGKQPFDAKDYPAILKLNKESKINFARLEGSKSMSDALKLLKNMVEPDPKNRPTATECLSFSYFQQLSETELEI